MQWENFLFHCIHHHIQMKPYTDTHTHTHTLHHTTCTTLHYTVHTLHYTILHYTTHTTLHHIHTLHKQTNNYTIHTTHTHNRARTCTHHHFLTGTHTSTWYIMVPHIRKKNYHIMVLVNNIMEWVICYLIRYYPITRLYWSLYTATRSHYYCKWYIVTM